jgi:hypothetical protein
MRRGTFLLAAIFIIVGLLLLLNNLGWFGDVNLWDIVWPLALVAFGVWILWGVLAKPGEPDTEVVSIPLDGAQQAQLRMDYGAGRLQVGSGAGPDELVTGRFGGGVDHRTRQEGESLSVKLRLPASIAPYFFVPGGWGMQRGFEWQVKLNDAVPLALQVETGASDTRLDLSDLQVTDLWLKTGASATYVTLPAAAGYTRAKVEAGVASVTVRIPPGVAARLHVKSGLSSTAVDRSRFPRVGGNTYQSPDYETAANQVEMELDVGLGSVSVR